MKKIFLLAGIFFCFSAAGQTPIQDSVYIAGDSVTKLKQVDSMTILQPGDSSAFSYQEPVKESIKPILKYPFTSDSFLYKKRLFFSFTNSVRYTISKRTWKGKEVIFYSIVALIIAFGLIRNAFRRYLSDLFSSYFRTTVRQRQVKDQLIQTPLPSLIFNAFFIISSSIFLSLLWKHFQGDSNYPFPVLVSYSAAALIVIYGCKFLLLKFFGWVFQMQEATDTYIFIVFATNKILGVFLLPFSVLLAFTYSSVHAASVTISLFVIGALFAYRYFLSYISVNLMMNINFFHFILYLAAFEVLPLLLINKLLFAFLSEIY